MHKQNCAALQLVAVKTHKDRDVTKVKSHRGAVLREGKQPRCHEMKVGRNGCQI